MRTIWIVFRKEVLENLRDRRTIFSALVFGPLFGPLLLAAILQFSLNRNEAVADEPISVAVVNGEAASNLLAYLAENNVTVQKVSLSDSEARRAVLDKLHKLVLVVPPDHAARRAAALPAPLLIYADSSDPFNDRVVDRVRALLMQHGQRLGQLRLLARGIDPVIAAPLAVQSIDVATPQSRAVLALGMLSYLIIFAMLMGGSYLAIDATAGERERGSLEPLFTTPAPRDQIVYGKILASAAFMWLSLILTVAACVIVVRFIRLEDFGMTANLGPLTGLAIIATTAPLALAGAGLLTVVASFTRSYREAQTYLGIVLIAPTLPLAFVSIIGLKPSLALMAVPSLSQHFLMTTLLRNEPIGVAGLALSIASSLALGLALAWLAARLYRRESMIAG